MLLLLFLITINLDFLRTSYPYYDYNEKIIRRATDPAEDDLIFYPIVNLKEKKENKTVVVDSGINCDEFPKYALNCTVESALIYNSSRKKPPMPSKMVKWCGAIRRLTNCAIDWDSECKDVTESHFNQESIKGHMHVVNNICDDPWFISRYEDTQACIRKAANTWESCYIIFKAAVDYHKNTTQEWTHYDTHFHLCCAQTFFRRCTLNALFLAPASKCELEKALIVQKFTIIVSEGEVFQDCTQNVMYTNCPGGDPRPSTDQLSKLMNADGTVKLTNEAGRTKLDVLLLSIICLIKLCC